MHKPDSRNFRRQIGHAMLLPMLFALTACGSLTWTPLPGGATGSLDAGPTITAYVCTEIKVVHYHLGKITAAGVPDLTQADVTAAIAKPDWFDQLHHLLGDTNETVYASKLNNSVLSALCPAPTP